MKRIFDVTFWVTFFSTVLHFYIWLLVKDSDDIEFTKKVSSIMFWSGGVAVLTYFFMPGPPVQNDEDEQ